MVEPVQVYALSLKVCDSCWHQYSPVCKWSKNSAVVSMLVRQSERLPVLGYREGCQLPRQLELLQSFHFNCFYRNRTLEFKLSIRQRWKQVQAIASCTVADGSGYPSFKSRWELHQCQWSNFFNQMIETAKPAWSEKCVQKAALASSWSFDRYHNTLTEPVSRKCVAAFLIFSLLLVKQMDFSVSLVQHLL